MRNRRWSVMQPIPSLGDHTTPIEDVDKFYNFWYNFKSWREFSDDDEYDLEQAESPEHKRWMERQNAKLHEKAKKVEYARVHTLVDNVYKKDPRIQMRKEEHKAEKQRRKEAKYLTKKLQEEEATRAAEEERIRKEEESKKAAEAAQHQKKLKEKERKLLRKEKTRLRTIAAPVVADSHFGMSKEDVESTCASLDMEQLKKLCVGMDGKDAAEKARLMSNALRNESSSKEEKKIEAMVWNVLLQILTLHEGTKSVLLQKPDSSKSFDSFLEKRKQAQSIASPLSTRDEISSSTDGAGTASSKVAQLASSQTANGKAVADPVPDEAPSVADPDAWTEALYSKL
ncbi:DnaJ domain [Zea mays]|uniref:DnaJ domain n=1 Tax=Zea mays TaxID=4577 RepID=A0A1D6P6Y3_MAIZE|nr:DnaJ domain [Zea mays]